MDEIEWWEFDTPAELAEQAAGDIGFVVESAVAAHGGARLALGAGTAAADAVLKALAAAKGIEWGKLTIVPTDEAAEIGLAALGKKGATIVPLSGVDARAADARLADLQWPLDLVMLTAGADGSVAGIAPGADMEQAVAGPRGRRVVASNGRLTLTADAITSARAAMLVVTGAEARAAVERGIEQGPLSATPVGRVMAAIDAAVDVFWTA